MRYEKPAAEIFIDANILKFSAVKSHAYIPRKQTINWGGVEHELELHEPFTGNNLHKITNDTQKRDAVFLGILAYAGISERMRFYTHREVYLETWGLPGMTSASGRFFGCPIHDVADPVSDRERIIVGGSKSFKEHTDQFLASIKHPRYIELTKMTGAYQGTKNPLNRNQALDAFHIWCAECAGIEYFLTIDYKLQKIVEQSKMTTPVSIKTPDQLLRTVLPKLGLVDAIRFLWQGYRFAKPRVGFIEGSGWS